MKQKHDFVCPKTKGALNLKIDKKQGSEIISGFLVNTENKQFKIRNGLPYLIHPEVMHKSEIDILEWYDNNYEVYDKYLPLTFKTFGVNESYERLKMIDRLDIQPNYKILETGAGTGRDSVLLAEKLSIKGELHVHDLHDKILRKSINKLKKFDVPVTHCVSNAMYLPYPDNYFDIYYHFGGFNTFSDKLQAFKEINRVVKNGGRVVVGDESMPPWLRDTEYGKILMNSNPHYKFNLPLEYLDPSSREVSFHYIIGGVFYYIFYTVGEGTPTADFDFEIPGARGGTHRTRYYGHLEGVSEKAVEVAQKAYKKSGKSFHKWLDSIIKTAAERELYND